MPGIPPGLFYSTAPQSLFTTTGPTYLSNLISGQFLIPSILALLGTATASVKYFWTAPLTSGHSVRNICLLWHSRRASLCDWRHSGRSFVRNSPRAWTPVKSRDNQAMAISNILIGSAGNSFVSPIPFPSQNILPEYLRISPPISYFRISPITQTLVCSCWAAKLHISRELGYIPHLPYSTTFW